MQLPKGYGYPLRATDALAAQPHDPQPHAEADEGVHDLRDRLRPEEARGRGEGDQTGAADLDGRGNGKSYPVFNVRKGSGKQGHVHLPRRGQEPLRRAATQNEWTVDRAACWSPPAATCIPVGCTRPAEREGASGLRAARRRASKERGRATPAHLFRSKAKYFEPAGAVSWDVAMTATRKDWRVKVHRATCSRPAPPTTRTAAPGGSPWGSWSSTWPTAGRRQEPVREQVDRRGKPTHGHLRENHNHGGKTEPTCPTRASSRTARRRRRQPSTSSTSSYQLGDLEPRPAPPATRR